MKEKESLRAQLQQRGHPARNTLGCMAGLTLDLICVAATGLLVILQ